MKISGRTVDAPQEEILILPRGDNPIVIRAKAVIDLDEFDKICPEPKPPGKLTKDGWVPNKGDKTYTQMMDKHAERRIAYLVIKSLEPSQIEWDTVDIDNPSTWLNYIKDFKAAGLASLEINRIVQCVMVANSLDESKLDEARAVFLLGQRPAPEQFSGQTTEQQSSPSGELANASDSAPQE
jgi:hypothetical protein